MYLTHNIQVIPVEELPITGLIKKSELINLFLSQQMVFKLQIQLCFAGEVAGSVSISLRPAQVPGECVFGSSTDPAGGGPGY
jgi:hypothetical protein